MDGIAQRMLERRKRRIDVGVVVGGLLAVAVSTLPMCDACHDAADAAVFADLGMGGSAPSALGPCLLWLAIGVAVAVVVGKLGVRRGEGIAVVALVIPVATLLIYSSSAKIARTRSAAVDTWETCFTSRDEFGGQVVGPVMTGNQLDAFDGPHQQFDGRPCVEEAEHRKDHRHEHPDGDVMDGLHQIQYRFRGDRDRVLYLPVVLLLALALALALTVIAAVRRPPPGPG
jgi:hypothetical protein